MSVIYGCNNFGVTAVGSYLERKHFPITFYLKNSKESRIFHYKLWNCKKEFYL